MNTQFLREANITRIVNTAKGLEIFGPKYLVSLSTRYAQCYKSNE